MPETWGKSDRWIVPSNAFKETSRKIMPDSQAGKSFWLNMRTVWQGDEAGYLSNIHILLDDSILPDNTN